ncbi:hypothetical protein E2C01_083407 [Portunus trituberculatus]|uniref:Uncharacterized protein n=1 Tax=Portunus trituberculatus TaxID=210409 RepID=A0A5B7ISD0_PORTR|nr:hypothetical protein [Portunus trituberculatus]
MEVIWEYRIFTDVQKFQLTIDEIPSDVAALICEILQRSPDTDKYPALKDALLQVSVVGFGEAVRPSPLCPLCLHVSTQHSFQNARPRGTPPSLSPGADAR